MTGLVRLAEIWTRGILELSIQIAILVAMATLFCWLSRRADPRLRHAVWLVVLLRLFLPWPAEAPFGLLRSPEPVRAAEALVAAMSSPNPADARPGSPAGSDVTSASPVSLSVGEASRLGLLLGWSGLVAIIGLVALIRHRRARRELEAAGSAPEQIESFVRRVSGQLGAVPPRVVLAPPDGGVAPLVFGVRPPMLVVPRRFADAWSETEHGPLLVHELMHIRHRDTWINLAIRVAQTVYFFHPLVWWAGDRIRRERELVCDDSVVRYYRRRPHPYLRALGQLWAGTRRRPARLASISLFERRSDLVERVRRLAAPGYSASRWRRTAIAAGLALGLGAVTLSVARTPGERTWDRMERLTSAEIGELERRVQERPGDLEARTRLLEGYTFSSDPQAESKRLAQVFWWIEHEPGMPADISTLAWIPLQKAEVVERARALWLDHLESAPNHPAVLANASQFLLDIDPSFAEALLVRGRELAPANPTWSLELSRIYGARARSADKGTRDEWLRRSLAEGLRGLELIGDRKDRYYWLKDIAWAAMRAGRLDLADGMAQELLRFAGRWPTDWNAGNAIHHAHLILGHGALERGDVAGAVAQLHAAADTQGSPQLASFGPRMTLAQQLLEAGERDAVLLYLERCGRFWNSSEGRLEAWAAAIRDGERLDFSTRRPS